MANPDNNLGRLGAGHSIDKRITPDVPRHRGPDLGNPVFEERHLIPANITGTSPTPSFDTILLIAVRRLLEAGNQLKSHPVWEKKCVYVKNRSNRNPKEGNY